MTGANAPNFRGNAFKASMKVLYIVYTSVFIGLARAAHWFYTRMFRWRFAKKIPLWIICIDFSPYLQVFLHGFLIILLFL